MHVMVQLQIGSNVQCMAPPLRHLDSSLNSRPTHFYPCRRKFVRSGHVMIKIYMWMVLVFTFDQGRHWRSIYIYCITVGLQLFVCWFPKIISKLLLLQIIEGWVCIVKTIDANESKDVSSYHVEVPIMKVRTL